MTKDLLLQYSVNSTKLARKKHTLKSQRSSGWLWDRLVRKRLVFGNIYVEGWKEIQEYCSLGSKPPGVSVTPMMDGHTGWEDGLPCRPESFICIPVILAEIRN